MTNEPTIKKPIFVANNEEQPKHKMKGCEKGYFN